MKNDRYLLAGAVALALLPGLSTLRAAAYNVIDLGTLDGAYRSRAFSINDAGQVVGYSSFPDDTYFATLFSGTGSGNINLGTLGGVDSVADAINNAGQIVGVAATADGGWHATLFSGTGSGNIDLGALHEPYNRSVALAINGAGQIVGQSFSEHDDGVYATLFSGTGSGNINLGTLGGADSVANAINNAGQIVGYASTAAGDLRATLFSGTGSGNIDLGTLGGKESEAYAINAAGQIIGSAQTAEGWSHATIFSGTGSGNIDLGTLGGLSSYASAINNAGHIVGASVTEDFDYHAFLYTPALGMVDLNTLVDLDPGWVIEDAYGINDSGWIIATGTKYDEIEDTAIYRDFLLVPVPEPAAIRLLVAAGLALVLARCRRGARTLPPQ